MVASQMPTSEEWIMLHYPYCPVVKNSEIATSVLP